MQQDVEHRANTRMSIQCTINGIQPHSSYKKSKCPMDVPGLAQLAPAPATGDVG